MSEEKHKMYEGTLEEISEQIEKDRQQQTPPAADPGTGSDPQPPAETPPADTPPAPPVQEFDKFKFLTETLGSEFKTDEDIENYKRSLTEWKGKVDEAEKKLKSVDPMKYFASQDDYIINQLKIKHPDLDPSVLMNTITTDMEKIDPLRLIAYRKLLSDPKHEVYENETQAYNHVLRETGYDPEVPMAEQSEEVKVAIRHLAKQAREEFGKLKSEVEVPKPIDLTAEQAKIDLENKQRYDRIKTLSSPDLVKIPEMLDKIDFTAKDKDGKDEVVFSFQMGDFAKSKRVQDVLGQVHDVVAKNALEWTPDMAKKVVQATVDDLKKDYLWANSGKIAKEMRESLYKKWNDEKFEKDNHNRPLNPDKTNPAMTEEQKKIKAEGEKFKNNLGLKGKKFYAP